MFYDKLFWGCLFYTLFSCITLQAQVSFTAPNQEYYAAIDRLTNDLKTAKDTNRVKVLTNLCWTYKNTNPLKALEYGEKALELAQKLNFRSGIANAYNYLGVVYFTQGNYQKALGSQLLHTQAFKKIKDKIGFSRSYQLPGIALQKDFAYQKALEYYQKSLEISQEMGNPFRVASPLTNLGSVYFVLNQYDNALEKYTQALEIYEEIPDSTMISITRNNIGKTYAQQQLPQKAFAQFQEAMRIAEKRQDSARIAMIALHLAKHEMDANRGAQAEEYARQSLELSQKFNLFQQIRDASLLLSKLFQQKGQFREALEYHQQYTQVVDSLYVQEESRRITEIQGLVESAQKRARQSLNKKDQIIKAEGRQLAMSYFYMTWIITGFTAILAFFFYRSNLHRKHHNIALQLQNEQINRQMLEINRSKESIEKSKIELLEKNQLIEQKNESFRRILNQLNENNIRLTNSIRYAEKIQRAFLPHENQFREIFSDHFIIFKPKDVVSGDFYWLNKVHNKIFMAVVDCTGHGVPGAFMSMIGNTLLNEIINHDQIFSPQEVLADLHKGVRWTLKQHDNKNIDGMDLALCCIEQTSNHQLKVEFSGAKSNLYYFHQGKLQQVKGDRKSIGGWQEETERTFQSQSFTIERGDILYFATDGYTDSPNPQRKKIGHRKFRDLLLENARLPMKEQGAALLETLYVHNANGEQRDDITIIGVQL